MNWFSNLWRGSRRGLLAASMGVAVLAAVVAWLGFHGPATAAAVPAVANEVPVETGTAERSTVPVYLEGLGNVRAFYTATITARLDGELQSVAFTEGEVVKKGQLLAQIDPRPAQAALDQATAQRAKDQGQLEAAQRDLDRYVKLAPQNLASQQTLDAERGLIVQLQAQIKIDAALIDNARTQLDYTRITSPITGRTGIRIVDPGNNVRATDTGGIVVVTQMQPISIVFTLPEDDLPAVSTALNAGKVTVSALSRDNQTELDTGTLTLIDNEIDPNTGTMKLKATFPNDHNTLWPGQFVNVRVLVQQQQNVLTLPSAAVQHGPNGVFTYVVKPDSTVEMRPLQTSTESDGRVIVTGGIDAGERVVTSNQYRLQPGTHVRAISGVVVTPPPGAALGPESKLAKRLTPSP
ncbi:MAG: efflux RND transporter periplasmic adaptor subunit [Steroidobacteraceae bacterium]